MTNSTDAKKTSSSGAKIPFWKNPETQSLFWTLALILFIRGFIAEPFKIPSGSMIPTLLIGDHLFVAKSSYDLGIPFTNKKLLTIGNPKRGDVLVFEYPNHEQDPVKAGRYYIKRLIGLPGDEIYVKGGIPYVNGVASQIRPVELGQPDVPPLPGFELNPNHRLFREQLPGVSTEHWVQRYPYRYADLPDALREYRYNTGKDCLDVGKAIHRELPITSSSLFNEICPFRVPENHYFMMGDNRDDSADSREWGFVDRSLIKGRALFIWLSWEGFSFPFLRWSRLGQRIQ